MSDILSLKNNVLNDCSITGDQFHSYSPYTNNFNHSDEIRIAINSEDLYVLPSESYIYLEGNLTGKTVELAAGSTYPTLGGNFTGYLFDEIRYEIGNVEVDRCRNVGITSSMKGYASYSMEEQRMLSNAGFNIYDPTNPGFFSYCIPLKLYLGFMEDYKKIVMNMRHQLILVRSRNNTNCFIGAHDTVNINITKIQWRIQHITTCDATKLRLLKHIDEKRTLSMAFRSWDLVEYPVVPQADRINWSVKTSNSVNRPRYVILGFQTNRNNVLANNASEYDHCNISNVKLFLNNVSYPQENVCANFELNQYSILYHMFAKFQETYYHQDPKRRLAPYMDVATYKQAPLIVFNCERQNESVKNSSMDIRLEIEARKNFPARTSGYCLIIHDNIVNYNPYTSIVSKGI